MSTGVTNTRTKPTVVPTQPTAVVGSKARARYVTFPIPLHGWLENEFGKRGYGHVNEFIIDIVRKAWEKEQQAGEPAANEST